MPFLEVVTRAYKRPTMLARNIASLRAQTDPDYSQVLLVDEIGIGVPEANAVLSRFVPMGEWVWVLDDDDMCIYDNLIADLKRVSTETPDIDAIMVRMEHECGIILPSDEDWKTGRMKLGGVGMSAPIVRRSTWANHCHAFASGNYYADFDFIFSLFKSKPRLGWLDVVASKVQRQSVGRTENED